MMNPEKQLLTFDRWLNFPRPGHARGDCIYYCLESHATYRFDGLSYVQVMPKVAEMIRFIIEKIEQSRGDVPDAIAAVVVEVSSEHGAVARQAIFGDPDIWLGTRLSVRKIVRAFGTCDTIIKRNQSVRDYANIWNPKVPAPQGTE